MENFIVSARKYRPATFDTVVGQEHITSTLKNAIKTSHVAQAFLFCGPRGVGKTTCARILAKTINCENLTPDTEPCDSCSSCTSFNKNGSLSIFELDAASNNSVEDIRNLIEQVRIPPQGGKKKVYIIDEVHMLSNQAFNAFLKTLEEPPPYAVFILATTEKHKIIPTILSRCQIFDFNRIQLKDISSHLGKIAKNEGITAEEEALHVLAQKADGALRDALSLFDFIVTFSTDKSIRYETTIKNLHVLDFETYIKITKYMYQENRSDTLLLFDQIMREGFDPHQFILGLANHFRDLLMCKDPKTIVLLPLSEQVANKYLEQSNYLPSSFILSCLDFANRCDAEFKSVKNQRLHVEMALIRMCHLSSALQLAHWIQEIKKKGLTPNSTPNTTQRSIPKELQQADRSQPSNQSSVEDNLHVKNTPAIPSVNLKDIHKEQKNRNQLPQINSDKEKDTLETLQLSDEQKNYALSEIWNTFGKKKETKDNELLNNILFRPLEKVGTTYYLNLKNPYEEHLFMQVREEWAAFMKQFPASQKSEFQVRIAEVKDTSKRKPYSEGEKLSFLKEKYPLLSELLNGLQLELL